MLIEAAAELAGVPTRGKNHGARSSAARSHRGAGLEHAGVHDIHREAVGEGPGGCCRVVRIRLVGEPAQLSLKFAEALRGRLARSGLRGGRGEEVGPIGAQELGHRLGGERHEQRLGGCGLLGADDLPRHPLRGDEACVLHVRFDGPDLLVHARDREHEVGKQVHDHVEAGVATRHAGERGLRQRGRHVAQLKGDLANHGHQLFVREGGRRRRVVARHVVRDEGPHGAEKLRALPVELRVDALLLPEILDVARAVEEGTALLRRHLGTRHHQLRRGGEGHVKTVVGEREDPGGEGA
mmetsp:Transcript_121215/g.339446  ORF Transcript_121215/g.339446 Transcript_121215/m.339446 type:complete len:296 (+) Transcript_121215:279-1166(+)